MLKEISASVKRSAPFLRLLEEAGKLEAPGTLAVGGLAGSLGAFVVAGVHEHVQRQLVLLLPESSSAEQFRDDLAALIGGEQVHFLSGNAVGDAPALRALAEGDAHIVVAGPEGLSTPLPAPGTIRERTFSLEAGTEAGLQTVVRRLQELGFERSEFVGERGEFAVRGGILDIFPFVGENPVRLEFFGDTIDSIREFEPISQRSVRDLSIAVIVPDFLRTDPDAAPARTSSLLDFCDAAAMVVLVDPDLLWSAVDALSHHPARKSATECRELLGYYPRLNFLSLGSPPSLDFGASPQPAMNGSVKILHAELRRLQEDGLSTWVSCDGQAEMNRIADLLSSFAGTDEAADEPVRVTYTQESVHGGFLFPAGGLAVFTEHQIFGRLRRRGRRRAVRFKGFTEREFQQVRKGDFVVHEDFGIGIFDGLKKIRVMNVDQEVASVLYAEKDRLYVNLNYINKLKKYSSKEGHVPKLTRLGSPEWERLKARTRGRVKEIARELIALYARRKHLEGFAFRADTPWQQELEASFIYEDTPDQARATQDVKQDMTDPAPMDRLICGDVGFGKTEVAVRAAFKAVMDSKQVAVLVPTTILAIQHFHTFLDRLGRYGVVIEVLSRLKTKQQQREILEGLAARRIDIVIGTHRLLSKDVAFKDLGLLVIDEEHRFGVAAKEKLRQLRVSVDTLSLTATPIPRTLHFSLMGARDLSVIATPPRNRLPIVTEIAQWEDDLVRDAILRELHHGGQVYVVHDRVHDMDDLRGRLQRLVPNIRIRTAHGQMHAHELEEVMLDFLERRVDVLLATKIIESGIDIPNVNTMIINRADRFGMAELYQLRGRVGRSNVQAYAYLLTPPISTLPRNTIRRLQAVQEFTELGSGFNLAMRDLEIRGAGNLLGAEQSGFIESMGFETYTRILEEAVQELKEEEFTELFDRTSAPAARKAETVVEVRFDALIPDTYVRDDTERLAIYRRLYAMGSEEQITEVREELVDRFGALPVEAEHLLAAVRIRLHAEAMGFVRVTIGPTTMEIEFPPDTHTAFYESERFQKIMQAVSTRKGGALSQAGTSLRYVASLPQSEDRLQVLEHARQILVRLEEGQ